MSDRVIDETVGVDAMADGVRRLLHELFMGPQSRMAQLPDTIPVGAIVLAFTWHPTEKATAEVGICTLDFLAEQKPALLRAAIKTLGQLALADPAVQDGARDVLQAIADAVARR